ncbi:MAG TPA: SRPBCC domain-containing protein [Sinomonas sp.]|nr:SRPBCC domain-containing protein [Sinomonas sp.]
MARVTVSDSTPDDVLNVRHDTFTLGRELNADPSAVFAAFADSGIRRRWFSLPGSEATYHHEFRVGGGETASSTFSAGESAPENLNYRSRYIDIVANRRIVFTYESLIDGVLRWTSLVTVLIEEGPSSTRLTWTEQVVFLARTGDGSADLPHLRGGTALRLNGLASAIGLPPGATG